jgi:hypothetical protein
LLVSSFNWSPTQNVNGEICIFPAFHYFSGGLAQPGWVSYAGYVVEQNMGDVDVFD